MNQPIEKTEEKAVKPDDFLTIKIRMPDEDEFKNRDLFMTAGLVRNLVGISQIATEDTTQLFTNPQLQELFLVEILSPRTKQGKPKVEYTSQDFDVGTEDGQRIIDWAINHVLYFFTSAVQGLEKAVDKNGGSLKTLTDSLNGLANSMDQKPSAGPTESKEVA